MNRTLTIMSALLVLAISLAPATAEAKKRRDSARGGYDYSSCAAGGLCAPTYTMGITAKQEREGRQRHRGTYKVAQKRRGRDCGEYDFQDAQMAGNLSNLVGFGSGFAGPAAPALGIVGLIAGMGGSDAQAAGEAKWRDCVRKDMIAAAGRSNAAYEGKITELGRQLNLAYDVVSDMRSQIAQHQEGLVEAHTRIDELERKLADASAPQKPSIAPVPGAGTPHIMQTVPQCLNCTSQAFPEAPNQAPKDPALSSETPKTVPKASSTEPPKPAPAIRPGREEIAANSLLGRLSKVAAYVQMPDVQGTRLAYARPGVGLFFTSSAGR